MVSNYLNPWNEMLSLREAMNQLLEGSVIRPGTTLTGAAAGRTALSFPLNVAVSGDDLTVEALLPGVSEEDLQIHIERGVLTIEAERRGWEAGGDRTWYLREILPGRFSRAISLPFPVDDSQVTADFAHGVLTLTLPKAAEARPKRIQVNAGHRQEQLTSGATS
ncbi:MAG TPA: Hsp20/alpha crystallin family protein [Thermomicrobiales bacterium]|nr:Hsp20/alpha crystallin family protein [Thermomicrobiales bacterium]